MNQWRQWALQMACLLLLGGSLVGVVGMIRLNGSLAASGVQLIGTGAVLLFLVTESEVAERGRDKD